MPSRRRARGAALTRGAWSARLAQVDGGRDDQTDLEADRQVANTLAELIIGGGSLASTEITSKARGGPGRDGQRGRQRGDVTEGAFTPAFRVIRLFWRCWVSEAAG